MIKKIRKAGEIIVVTATDDFHPLRQLKVLSSELSSLGFEGLVIFDLLAVNGLSDNRFASMMFFRGNFVRNSFSVDSNVPTKIVDEQNSLAKNDLTFLAGTVLSSSEVNCFVH